MKHFLKSKRSFKKYINYKSVSFILFGLIILSIIVFKTNIIRSSNAETSSFTFTAAGDYGNNYRTDAVLSGIASTNPAFHIALGDLSYGYLTEPAWCDYVKGKVGQNFPFQLIAGNHEDDFQTERISNFAACLPNKMANITGDYAKEYYYDYQGARFILISPNLKLDGVVYDYAAGTSHYNWLSNVIDDARANGIKWIVVSEHENCLSIGNKACEIKTDLLNLLVSKKVDLVLQGHDHDYQRTKQLALGSGCSYIYANAYNSNCVANNSLNQYTKGDGTIIAIVGVGGVDSISLNTSDPEAPYFAAWNGGTSNPPATWGFLKVDISDTTLSANFIPSYPSNGYTDSFTISDSGLSPTPTLTPTPTPIASTLISDSFNRTVTSGWGSADTGGAYSLYSTASNYGVSSGAGNITMPANGNSRGVLINGTSAQDIDITFKVTTNKTAAGGTQFVYSLARRNGNNEYRPRILLNTNGTISAHASRLVNNSESSIGSPSVIAGLNQSANSFIRFRAQVTGQNPTTIKVKAWADGQNEPSNWNFIATDSTPELQQQGFYGIRTYISSSTTNAPVTMSFDDYLVANLGIQSSPTPSLTPTSGPTPTLTLTPTPTPTQTPTPTPLPTQAPTPTPISSNILQNPGFENSGTNWLSPWIINRRNPAQGSITKDTATFNSGAASAKVNITTASTDWYYQLLQKGFGLTAGTPHTISFYAKASANRNIKVAFQQNYPPYAVYYQQANVALTTSWKKFTYTFTPSVSESNALFVFNLAASTGQIWIDDVSLIK